MPALDDLVSRSCNPETSEIPDSTGGGVAGAAPGGRPGDARASVAVVIPMAQYLRERAVAPMAERAANPAPRESDGKLPRPVWRSPWSEDRPSPRCRLADAREGAKTFGGIYWLADAVPLLISLLAVAPLGVLADRPGRFWAVAVLVTAFSLFLALH